MAWWSDAKQNPKMKNRFIVEMGNGGRLLAVSSVSKPTATVEKKEYRLINHYYNYPGLVRWEPITIKFVDAGFWGDANNNLEDFGTIPSPKDRGAAHTLWEMLLASGYTTPNGSAGDSERNKTISAPEKAASMSISFGESLKIHQLAPEGQLNGVLKSTEVWDLKNPIITKISWGELDYGDDGLVEYTLDVSYDWAEFSAGNSLNVSTANPTIP